MSKEVEVTKIVVAMGGTETQMTIEQAKKLYRQLDQLFGEPKVVEKHIHHRNYWTPAWMSEPVQYTVESVPSLEKYEITCQGNTALLAIQ